MPLIYVMISFGYDHKHWMNHIAMPERTSVEAL